MAVILNITYQKKLGLPGFSSHSCSISLTTEIDRKEMAAEESAKLYAILQAAVDKEIQQVGFMPDPVTYGFRENGSANGNGHSNGNGNGHQAPPYRWACTEGQRTFIQRLVTENNLNKDNVEALAQQLFNTSVRQLNKMQASQLIEELLVQVGQPPQKNRWRKAQPANGS